MRKEKKALFIGIVAIVLAVAAIGANANIISHSEASDKVNVPDVPHKINYQGYLTDAAGNQITGYLDMTFRIYDSPTGGTQLWSEAQTAVHVENGLFTAILGSVNPIPGDVFPIDGSRWLETEIEGQTLTPRKEIVSVAYALKADKDNDWCGAGTGEMYTCCPDNVSVIGGPGSYIKVGMPQVGYWTTFSYEYDGSMYDTYIRNPCGKGDGCDLILDFPYGNVSIGSTEPKAKLHVEGDAYISNNLTIGTPLFFDGVNERIGIGTTDPQKKLDIASETYEGLGICLRSLLLGGTSWNIDNDKGVFEIAEHVAIPPEYPRTKITASRGEVGIEAVDGEGKPVPGAMLHVFGGKFMINSAPATWVGGYSTEINGSTITGDCVGCPPGADTLHLGIADNQGSILMVEDGGNVGIGTKSPGYKLHVNGSTGLENPEGNPGPDVLRAFQHSSVGRVGYFAILNANNPAPALTVQTQGTGAALRVIDGDIEKIRGRCLFVEDHPQDLTKEIVYVCLEGPEAGTYIRATAQLVNGEAVINLPEHFSLVTSEEGLTVQLTPVGEWLQLYVVKKSPQQIIVREANGKNGRFDYIVQGVRKGYEDHQVIRDKE